MLCGQHWIAWSPMLNEWVDIAQEMGDDERRWRQRPQDDYLLPWFLVTHARFTENPPILTFVPGPDSVDAELAEVMDTAYKTLWREVGMPDAWDEVAAWVIACGRGYLQTRIDPNGGPWRDWVADAELPMLGPDGRFLIDQSTGEPVTQFVQKVPFNEKGEPLMRLTPDGPQTLGEPHRTREGTLAIDCFSPLEVRGEWGPSPWYKKRWHTTRTLMTPEAVFDRFGVECEPTVFGDGADGAGGQYLRRLLLSAGHFGASSGRPEAQMDSGASAAKEGWVEVTSSWEAPCNRPGYEQTPESPGGRLLVVSPTKVLRDGSRPARYPYCSGIRSFGFVRLPGRVHETTPLEAMLPVQRAINRGEAQILEHRALVTNPKYIIDRASGLAGVPITAEPGEGYEVNRRPHVPPIEWVSPPPLSDDVYRTQDRLASSMERIGQTRGTDGAPPTPSASGALVQELRSNTDRYVGPPLRRTSEEFGRMAEDWKALLPLIWDEERVISYAGEDNVVRTLTVMPHLWEEGKVNVVPDLESMLPEGRSERQARVHAMWQDGVWGDPRSPAAIKQYLELARFPNLSRVARPGGPDRVTAEHLLGAALQGADISGLPWFPWYDELVHLDVFEGYMKSPEYLKQDPAIQRGLAQHWETLHQLATEKAMQAAAMMAPPPDAAPGKGGPGGKGAPPAAGASVVPPPANRQSPLAAASA